MALRHSLGEQLQRLVQLQADMQPLEQRLDEYAHRGVAVQRYQRVPGVGPLTATALRAGAGPEAEHADNTSGLRGRLNDRHPLRDFHDGPGIHAHRKAEYTNATAPLRDSKINRGTYRLTEESIYELLGATAGSNDEIVQSFAALKNHIQELAFIAWSCLSAELYPVNSVDAKSSGLASKIAMCQEIERVSLRKNLIDEHVSTGGLALEVYVGQCCWDV